MLEHCLENMLEHCLENMLEHCLENMLEHCLEKKSPYFEVPIQNVTAQVGRTAKLTCVVENLGYYKNSVGFLVSKFSAIFTSEIQLELITQGKLYVSHEGEKVAWGYKGTGAVLTVSTQVVTNNPRITIQREQRSTWVLTIANITMQDQGHYWCQVNTSPPRSITGYLAVAEPPVLDGGDEEVTVNRGASANLTCRAHGTPTPTIRWVREDYDRIRITHTHFVTDYIGSSLLLQDVTQRSAGGYLCIASNGHPPSISKKIIVHVNYMPEVKGPEPTTWASVGATVSLTCLFTAHPAPRVVWMRENFLGSQLLNNDYFTVTPQDGHPPYTHNMTLKMRKLVPSDFGVYTCIIGNFLGEAQATTVLRGESFKNSGIPFRKPSSEVSVAGALEYPEGNHLRGECCRSSGTPSREPSSEVSVERTL
nr:lachesin-like [Cherax quadricarinatus]